MAYNTNTSPYYDDFDSTKQFLRQLFVPGRAVQARELTQTQTMLQNQMGEFGKHVFKDGSKVIGGQTTLDVDMISIPVNSGSGDITDFINEEITDSTTGAKAKVIQVDSTNKLLIAKSLNGYTFTDNSIISGLFHNLLLTISIVASIDSRKFICHNFLGVIGISDFFTISNSSLCF